jgi:hypothetical protein
MSNALRLYEANKLRVACGISHYNETTLDLCLNSIKKMKAMFVEQRVINGKTPMCASFNAALDFACDVGADVLFHTASDVIVEPNALVELLKIMDIKNNYLVLAKGYDSIHGQGSSVGIWIWNMRIVGREFRFRDVFKQDMDICLRIEKATRKTRDYTPKELNLGYHHLIWTPEELFTKYRYSLPKYSGKKQIQRMKDFLETGLKENLNNKVLLAGKRGAEAAERYGALPGAKDAASLHKEFLKSTVDLHLDGSEYYSPVKKFESKFEPVIQSMKIKYLKTKSEEIREKIIQIRNSTPFQLGFMITIAVVKPGRNTLLLPYRMLTLIIEKLRKRSKGKSV